MCVDYRALNHLTKKDSYPIARVDDSLDAFGGCSVFSTIGLESGSHKILGPTSTCTRTKL
jgi:hypothetical protein